MVDVDQEVYNKMKEKIVYYEQFENFNNQIFVEWKQDKFYIEMAWKYLRPWKKQKFKVVDLWWSATIYKYLENFYKPKNITDIQIIWLFDFDSAFSDRDWIRNWESQDIDTNLYTWLCKKHLNWNFFVLLLPIPIDNFLKKQVVPQQEESEGNVWLAWISTIPHYWNYSEFEIESLFYWKIGVLWSDFFWEHVKYPSSEKIIKPNKEKIREHIDVLIKDNTLNADYFIYFEPLIKKIEELFWFVK